MNDFPLYYKDHALMRCGNIIYYGNMSEKYIVAMQILSSVKDGGLDLAGKVSVQLQLTDPEIRAEDRVKNSAERMGLFAAVDLAYVWLDRALNSK